MISVVNDVILILKNRLRVSVKIKKKILRLLFIYISFIFMFSIFLENCKAIIIDVNSTLGMLIKNDPIHGKCKNFNTIEGIKECSGTCQSSTSFDSGNNA